MLFNSIEFAIFLPIVFLLYWFVFSKNARWQNICLILASYTFYGMWDWRFMGLLAFTTLTTWFSGLYIGKYAKLAIGGGEISDTQSVAQKKAKAFVACNIILNLLILCFFKYFNFFVDSFVELFTLFGVTLQKSTLQIILPVGISFYTFQALSYSIDVYRGKIEPTKDALSFFAFVSFFPQVLAGPISRSVDTLPQYYQKRTFSYDQGVDGMRQILWGLFKKVVVADNCAVYVNQVFADYQNQSGSTLLLGAIFYTIQIYGDFSGYSDMAIGVAKLLGIKLKQNFNVPYFSRDVAEFWRRWHISLNTWFVQYLYIPLGGSKPYVSPESKHPELTKKAKVIRNTFAIFLTSGLWHGANWTFVFWGFYHALLFVPLILLGKNKRFSDTVAEGRFLPNIKEVLQMFLTFMLICIGWIFFRSNTITDALQYIGGLFNITLFSIPNHAGINGLFLSIAILAVTDWLMRTKSHSLDVSNIKQPILRYSIYLVVLFVIFAFGGHAENFIYFQF